MGVSFEEALLDVGRQCGRESRDDMQPIIEVLWENWYRTIPKLLEETKNGTDKTKLREIKLPDDLCEKLLTKLQDLSRQTRPDTGGFTAAAKVREDADRTCCVYWLQYSHAPEAWLDALKEDPDLQKCKEELLNEPCHVVEMLDGTHERLLDPCTLDARVLGFRKLEKLPMVFVRPVEVYRGLMDCIWKDSRTPPDGDGTGTFRHELDNRHIFVSEDLRDHVTGLLDGVTEQNELPHELLAAEPTGVQVKQKETPEKGKQLKKVPVSALVSMDELTVSFLSFEYPSWNTKSIEWKSESLVWPSRTEFPSDNCRLPLPWQDRHPLNHQPPFDIA
jgi:hypothetical protein